ncbi:hypothetical protein AVEN_121168-1 [Araneus ventricosus]|uniref:Uncharacterized protein n=1 Tax=Araneus ventricosus TaxID=182803 RepID=A0A4Y2E224_ARAVE|nr:hypothetical protein AVEN_121168-1 [Araneus ventricosus]
MLIKVDEFPSGLVKTESKPNNGERETSEWKKIERAKGILGREGKKEQHTFSLRQRLHQMQLKSPPNLMGGKVGFVFRSVAQGANFNACEGLFPEAAPICVSSAY